MVTQDECVLALGLLLRKYPEMDFGTPPRRRDFEAAIEGAELRTLEARILDQTIAEHLIPDSLLVNLQRGLRVLTAGRLSLASRSRTTG